AQGHSPAPASFASRAGAKVLDWFLLILSGIVIQLLLSPGQRSAKSADPFFVIWLGWPLAYYVVFIGLFGQTPGKMVANIRVVRDLDDGPAGFARALARALAQVISDLSAGYGYFRMTFDPRGQALHDIIARTRVIDAGQTEQSQNER